MKNKELNELLDKYVLNTLSDAERQRLDDYVRSNTEFVKEMKLRTDIYKGMEIIGNEDLKTLLNKIHDEEISNPPVGKARPRLMLYLTLLLLVMVIIIAYIKLKPTHLTGEQLYVEYFSGYEASLQSRGSSDILIANFEEDYSRGEYQMAINAVVNPEDIDNNQLRLKFAVAQMHASLFEEATENLKIIVDSGDSFLSDHARWFLALSYIKLQQYDLAENELRVLSSKPGADHHQEAVQLLESIPE